MTEIKLKKQLEIESGYLTCRTCNIKRELYNFTREVKYGFKIYYKDKRCKICITGRNPKSIAPKTLKIDEHIKLSKDTKEFIKRVIKQRYYIDSIDTFKLAHHHINTFGHFDRLILDIELELTTMFKELLSIYKREEKEGE